MKKVNKAINRIISEINQNPFIFRNEADIQARLYYYLCDELDEWKPTHKTKYNEFQTNLVHREYFGGGNQSIDLVIFDSKDVQNIAMNSMEKTKSKEYVHLSNAIEIKTELGYYHERSKKDITKDINKLKKLRKDGNADNLHMVVIVRWDTKNEQSKLDVKKFIFHLSQTCKKNKINFYTNKENIYFPMKTKQKKQESDD
jgi:hypothetical protein